MRGVNLRVIAEKLMGASGAEIKGCTTEAGMDFPFDTLDVDMRAQDSSLKFFCVCMCLITELEWVTPARSPAHLCVFPPPV